MKKMKKNIQHSQKKYKRLREKARVELSVLEEEFGKGRLDQISIYSEIKKHLEAHQKEISYFGLRGVIIGLATAIFGSLFTNQILPNLGKGNDKSFENNIFNYVLNLIGGITVIVIFIFLFLMATGDIFLADVNRRKQIYINEYMLKLVEEKMKEINDKK